jgi:hypothetical protein
MYLCAMKDKIKQEVLNVFLVKESDLQMGSRKRPKVTARTAFCYLLNNNTNLNQESIAIEIGAGNRSNVSRMIEKANHWISFDKDFKSKLDRVKFQLNYSLDDDTKLKVVTRIMSVIDWEEKGTTRINLEKLLA